MHEPDVAAAYDRLHGPYTELFGSVELLHPRDRELVTAWRDTTRGPLLDAGCGPGQWTDLLAASGRTVVGLDVAQEFLRSAASRFPGPVFVEASLGQLPIRPSSVGGILAWYSLIHLPPKSVPDALSGFASTLTDGGSLLLGFFDGASGTPFDHKVATAHFWAADDMADALATVGLLVTHVETRQDEGARPHVAMIAEKRS
ncbi:class I SAM-dependent methyltransferase [Tessaracoccus terricola]